MSAEIYTLNGYGQMIADQTRMEAYAKAIARAVRPGDVVVDLGCGVGMFALLACHAGARRVYAMEGSEIVEWGKQLAAANGFAEKIVFLQSDSRQIELPERANVIVSDVRGALPLYGEAIESIEDARQRFLAPGGILIPQSDTLCAAIVETDKTYEKITAPWRRQLNGLDLACVLPAILNSSYQARIASEGLLTEGQKWCRLEYAASPNKRAAANLHFQALRHGNAHGIGVWFETQLLEEIGFTTRPSAEKSVYGRIVLPWPEQVTLEEGEEIEVELHADPVAGTYIWRWDTRFPGRTGQPGSCFCQSTFQSGNYSHEGLRRRESGFVPAMTELGEAQRWMLQAMDGKTPLQEIAQAAAQHFPKVFRTVDEAIRTAAELSGKFSK